MAIKGRSSSGEGKSHFKDFRPKKKYMKCMVESGLTGVEGTPGKEREIMEWLYFRMLGP